MDDYYEVRQMSDITTLPLLRHLRSAPTTHVLHLSHGRTRHDAAGVSFWFRPLSAAISEVPVDDRELPLQFRARTSDFQEVFVQLTVTFRVTEPSLAARRIDFSVDLGTGRWRATPLEQLGSSLTELAQQYALDLLARTSLADALVDGVAQVRSAVAAGLADDPRLAEIGLTVIGVRVVALRPDPEVERALQTPARELVQQEADRATYERRANAVDRERAIAENELANQIELATREEALVTQRGTNERRRATEAAAAGEIETAAEAARRTTMAGADAEVTRLVGAADGDAEAARLAAYEGTDAAVLLAVALRELAGNLPAIEHLTLTPDLVTQALARLTAGSS
jgi:regulator of protease activity HflC (stomatin/prohibitin superfamily)